MLRTETSGRSRRVAPHAVWLLFPSSRRCQYARNQNSGSGGVPEFFGARSVTAMSFRISCLLADSLEWELAHTSRTGQLMLSFPTRRLSVRPAPTTVSLSLTAARCNFAVASSRQGRGRSNRTSSSWSSVSVSGGFSLRFFPFSRFVSGTLPNYCRIYYGRLTYLRRTGRRGMLQTRYLAGTRLSQHPWRCAFFRSNALEPGVLVVDFLFPGSDPVRPYWRCSGIPARWFARRWGWSSKTRPCVNCVRRTCVHAN